MDYEEREVADRFWQVLHSLNPQFDEQELERRVNRYMAQRGTVAAKEVSDKLDQYGQGRLKKTLDPAILEVLDEIGFDRENLQKGISDNIERLAGKNREEALEQNERNQSTHDHRTPTTE